MGKSGKVAALLDGVYQRALRPLLFAGDAERAHDLLLSSGEYVARTSIGRAVLDSIYQLEDPALSTELFGLHFKNRFGVAAGFDKNCRATHLFSALGFGHIEIGTVTPRPQSGNPKPRVFRFAQDRALINRMGFPSEGAEAVARRLEALRCSAEFERSNVLIGINIGKNRETSVDAAHADYLACFTRLRNLGDYFVLNVSSPNTPELRKLQEEDRLRVLLQVLHEANPDNRPLLVKVAPDLSNAELDRILDVSIQGHVSGIVATNTTVERTGLTQPTEQQGGLSGAPLFSRVHEIVMHIKKVTSGRLPIVAVGGVMNCEAASALFAAGAELVQIYTGLVYYGPGLVRTLKSACLQEPYKSR